MRGVALNFPFCPDKNRDEKIRPIVDQSIQFAVTSVGADRLRALILMGSLSRGEGSMSLSHGREWRLLGDMEFLVVLSQVSDTRCRKSFRDLSRAATQEIGSGGQRATIEYGPVGPDFFLRKLKPSIFAYDLRFARVVWGDPDILCEMPGFTAREIPQEKCLELLMNRMVERLIFAEALPGALDPLDDVYHMAKTYLDLPASVLAFCGQHEPRHLARPHAFSEFLKTRSDMGFLLQDLDQILAEIAWAADFKRAPEDANAFLAPPWEDASRNGSSQSRSRLGLQIRWMTQAWAWEMQRLCGSSGWSLQELVHDYLAHEPLQQRLKGWAKFYLHPLRPAGALSTLRMARRLWSASPHALTYAAAVLAYASLKDANREAVSTAADLLPVKIPTVTKPALLRSIGDTWTWLIRNN